MAQVKINTLGYCVYQALADLDLPTSRYFTKVLHYAIEGYRELNLSGAMPSIKYVELPVNKHTNTALLPADYVDYLRIGVNCHGIFINLDYNGELILKDVDTALPCECDGHHIQKTVNAICNCAGPTGGECSCGNCNQGWYWAGSWAGGWNYDNPNFGIGPGFYHGGYRINNQLRVIQFDSCLTPKVAYIEYISNGMEPNGDAVINSEAIPAINYYIHWRMKAFSKDRWDNQQANNFRRLYLVAKQDLEMRLNALNRYEYLDIIRRYCFQAVKS